MNEFLVKLIANGGPGSGNFNPGQGRGKGKPGNGSSSKSSEKSLAEKEHDKKQRDIIDKYSAKWKEKGLNKPATSIANLEKQIEDARELLKEFSKEHNPADARELKAFFRVQEGVQEMERTLARWKEDEALREKMTKDIDSMFKKS